MYVFQTILFGIKIDLEISEQGTWSKKLSSLFGEIYVLQKKHYH